METGSSGGDSRSAEEESAETMAEGGEEKK